MLRRVGAGGLDPNLEPLGDPFRSINGTTSSPYQDPNSSGMPRRHGTAEAYIGWRTTEYGPVSITR
jgi:hypothetical protein